MSTINHLNDRKRIYVDELESILDQIEHWEYELETDDIPGNRDPEGKRYDREMIAKYQNEFNMLKAKMEAEGKNIYYSQES